MLYCSWDIACGGCNYFSFWAIFCPFIPLTARKIKILKKMKKTGDTIIFHKCTKNYDQMLYCSWDMAHDRCNCYFSFGVIFCTFTTLTAQKIKILRKWEKRVEISSFYIFVLQIMTRWCMLPEMVRDRRTDGKSNIKRGVPHLKNIYR